MCFLERKDNSLYPKESFMFIKVLTDKVADKTLSYLEREGVFVFPELVDKSNDLSRDQMIIQSCDKNYRTGNILGYIGCGNEYLEIKSRFINQGCNKQDNNGEESKEDFFFQYLLNKVLDFPNFVNLKTSASKDKNIFNYLLFLFPYYLKKAIRKGLFKRYVNIKYNDTNVKGCIDVARHIKNNTPFIGKIAYNQREFSYDNYLIELVRHTIEFIKRKSYGKQIINTIKEEVKLIIETTNLYEPYDKQKIITKNKDNPIQHAYYKEYAALQRLCILILRNQKHQVGLGTKQIYGILFDGAWLWEEYINSLVVDYFHHPQNKAKSGKQYLFSGKRCCGKIYPDFIGKKIDHRIIADAKYKFDLNISGPDYQQLLAYMFRFDSKMGIYFYPEASDDNQINDVELYLNRGTSYDNNVQKREDVKILKMGLKIPQNACNYEDFVEKIMISESLFMQNLKKIM